MAVFILITATYMGGYVNGYGSVTYQEFSSREKCEVAVGAIKDWAGISKNYILATCVPK